MELPYRRLQNTLSDLQVGRMIRFPLKIFLFPFLNSRSGQPIERLNMKRLLAILLCLLFPVSVLASDNSYKVIYDGGSLQNAKAGMDMKLYIDSSNIRIVKGKTEVATVPASAITEISYGQDVHRRVGAAIGVAVVSFGIGALLALSKSKKHFVGLTWDNGGQKGGFAFQADKSNYRGLLAGLEGVTGKKAVDSDAMTVKN
jgi:hypothetical protein